MPVVSTRNSPIYYKSALPLSTYARLIEYDECAFFGVDVPGASDSGYCRNRLWRPEERVRVMAALADAQDSIEKSLKTKFGRNWSSPSYPINVRTNVINVDVRDIIGFGQKVEVDVAGGTKLDVTDANADPFVWTVPIGHSITQEMLDAGEVDAFLSGTDTPVELSAITLEQDGTITLQAPKCRMVDNSISHEGNGLAYNISSNFHQMIDVKRIYTDTTVQAEVICAPCSCHFSGSSNNDFTETTYGANVYLDDTAPGRVFFEPTDDICGKCCSNPKLKVYIEHGIDPLDISAQNSIMMLAHSRMPKEPCTGCSIVKGIWDRDRNIPEILEHARFKNPLGNTADGAWYAWTWIKSKLAEYTSVRSISKGNVW